MHEPQHWGVGDLKGLNAPLEIQQVSKWVEYLCMFVGWMDWTSLNTDLKSNFKHGLLRIAPLFQFSRD